MRTELLTPFNALLKTIQIARHDFYLPFNIHSGTRQMECFTIPWGLFFQVSIWERGPFRNLKNSRLVIYSNCSGKAVFFGFNLRHHAFCNLFQHKKQQQLKAATAM